MTTQLKLTLITASLLVFFFIFHFIRKSKLSNQMAVIWILWSIFLIIISIFHELIYNISYSLGIVSPINGLFLIMMFILYILVFFLYLKISVLENKVTTLAQHIAINEKKSSEENK